MKASQLIYWLLAFVTTVHALTIPGALSSFTEASQSLFKRKGGGGGGGGGGRGGGSSAGSSSGTSSGTSSAGGSRGNSGSSSSSGATGSSRGSTSSNAGGRTTTGSGPAPAYGNGYYGGGAAVPYRSGVSNGVTPYFLGGAALGALAFSSIWIYGAYAYSYGHPWTYRNSTSGQNQTVPATCLCEQYQECGCDDNNSTDYQNQVANSNLSRLAVVNGTQTLFINGTLPNGTTSDGGDEDPYSNAARHVYGKALEMSGFWVVIAGVVYSVSFM